MDGSDAPVGAGTPVDGEPDPGPARAWWRTPLPWVAVLVVAAVAVGVWRLAGDGTPALTQRDVDRAVQAQLKDALEQERNAPPDAALAYRRIAPSVVTVVVSGASSLGAGVVVNDRGYVLTASHVVHGARTIEIRFADGTRSRGRILGDRPEQDLAVIGADRLPPLLVPAVMGSEPQVGDDVFPVGNPLGLTDSLSAGVVSHLDRTIRTQGGQLLKGLIQVDAAVNPGNSGGPLVNRQGQVVGVITGIANPSRQPFFSGIGFAVPLPSGGGGPLEGPLK